MYTDGLNHFTRINGNTLSHISSQAGQPISSDEIHILVVWQGKLAKENVSHQPKLYVLIQQIEIDSNVFSLLNQYFLIKVPSSKPHEFSIGSIFRVNSKTFIKVGITVKEKKHFQFKNANKLSQYISPLELNKGDFILNAFKNISPLNKSRLIYENLIKIKCKNNKTIYIPAMLFFTSYYGSSNEIHRLLLTRPYSYIEAFISKKIFSPQELVYPCIHFKCDKKFTELDAVFMNAMFWTKRNKESVAETIQTIQKHDPKKPLELKPNVYFNDFTYIAAYSFQIGKNEYLISEIDKSSMPSTDKDTVTVSTAIEAIKTNKKNDGEKNLPHGFRPNDTSELEKKPLDSEAVAGHDSPKIVKHSAKTQYICHVNNIKNTKPIELYDSTSASLNKPDIESLATGEKYGTNKKTGRLIEHFGKLLDTHKQKTIDDIYKACLYLQNNSNLINCVSVYNAGKKEFIETPEKLTLVAFDLLIESEEPDYINSSLINNWVKISKDNNRGCCILRIENDNISFYLLEIERKMKMDGVSERGSYKLFSFQLKDEDCFEECLSQILKEIGKSKGRTSVLPSNCTLNSKGHPHTHSKYDDITYLNLIKNIIKHHS